MVVEDEVELIDDASVEPPAVSLSVFDGGGR